MLPFSLKVAWFTLSVTGLLSCWVVLMIFAKVVGSRWLPLLYCLGVTLLQVVFCLGMIWHMDPFLMPKAFCITQIVVFSFGSFFLTGVTAAFTFSTAGTVLRRTRDPFLPNTALTYQHIYLIPVVVFPLVASTGQITAVIKLDAARPSDDMHCDAQPIWVRFLGYAGVSVAVSIPCLFVAAFTAWVLIKAHNDSQRNHRRYGNVSNICSLPALQEQSFKYGEPLESYQSDIHTEPPFATSPAGLLMSTLQAHSRTALSPDMSAPKVHLPPEEPPASQAWIVSSDSSTARDDLYKPGTPTSFIFPRFASPSQVSSVKDPWPTYPENDDRRAISDDFRDSDAVSSLRWARDKDLASVTTEIGKELDERHPNFARFERNGLSRQPLSNSPSSLTPAIWRLVLFQMAFFSVEILAALSTVIDITANDGKPSPFGTQHVALILAAWGPCVIFGHTPAIRSRLMFWR